MLRATKLQIIDLKTNLKQITVNVSYNKKPNGNIEDKESSTVEIKMPTQQRPSCNVRTKTI